MRNLSGKIALVTGSATNLGHAIAVDLAQQKINVAIHYHKSKKEALRTLQEVNKLSRGFAFQADLTDQQLVMQMFKSVKEKLGNIDILINLIGNFIYQPIDKTDFRKFRDVIESNLYSSFLCCQNALPEMKRKKWGRIINFGCVGAESLTVRKNTTPYYIAKTGVIMLTRVLA